MTELDMEVSRLEARLESVRTRIVTSARSSGRSPDEIKLIAVSKTQPLNVVRLAAQAGLRDFGENRLQEAEQKIEGELVTGVRWHLIGHLQSNKARRAVKLFDFIQSVDSASLVERLERICDEESREELEVLVQVDLAGETTKTGAREEELPAIVESLTRCRRVRCRGLMTLPPYFEDTDLVRPYYERLRTIRDELAINGVFGESPGELSMGMSHDFEEAIEEGATMVRVGTAIFGERI
jgi:PLP dependent protein